MAERLIERHPCNDCRLKLYIPCNGPCKKWYEWYQDVLEKLLSYEIAEEDGRLYILPAGVNVGDMVYKIYRSLGEGSWEVRIHKIKLEDIPQIGKTVFLTREEAEEAKSV